MVGRLADTPNLNNSALVNVYVVPQPVEAIISGGDYRQVVFLILIFFISCFYFL